MAATRCQSEAHTRRRTRARAHGDARGTRPATADGRERTARHRRGLTVRQMVFEAERVTKAYGGRTVVQDFSTRIMRRDRIGSIGPNGAGKTTLLRLLMGTVEPDEGDVRRGTNVEIVYSISNAKRSILNRASWTRLPTATTP